MVGVLTGFASDAPWSVVERTARLREHREGSQQEQGAVHDATAYRKPVGTVRMVGSK